MTLSGNRRSAVSLYSNPVAIDSHRVRLMLAEKGIACEIIEIDPATPPADFLAINPQASVPTLVDRDLVIHDARVITDYLDERYPHPPFMPDDPVSRARTRLTQHRIETDWMGFVPDLEAGGAAGKAAAAGLRSALQESDELFAAPGWFLSADYSILDVHLAPLFWRLPHYGLKPLPESGALAHYMKRLFARAGFVASLSTAEQGMRA